MVLIARLQEIAAQRGAWVIYVQADYVDPPAIDFPPLAGKPGKERYAGPVKPIKGAF